MKMNLKQWMDYMNESRHHHNNTTQFNKPKPKPKKKKKKKKKTQRTNQSKKGDEKTKERNEPNSTHSKNYLMQAWNGVWETSKQLFVCAADILILCYVICLCYTVRRRWKSLGEHGWMYIVN
ncbi:hypothetical protein EYC80_001980 [Monilinia laxa]|uniref:Uncharacterized protein n=1 Tax=Monilinia laxa TaxID=61186 RepID=A0A5N6K7F4_MONLA|nr:hypothetical protein EYC80_001980 [Monilinia laxa]